MYIVIFVFSFSAFNIHFRWLELNSCWLKSFNFVFVPWRYWMLFWHLKHQFSVQNVQLWSKQFQFCSSQYFFFFAYGNENKLKIIGKIFFFFLLLLKTFEFVEGYNFNFIDFLTLFRSKNLAVQMWWWENFKIRICCSNFWAIILLYFYLYFFFHKASACQLFFVFVFFFLLLLFCYDKISLIFVVEYVKIFSFFFFFFLLQLLQLIY